MDSSKSKINQLLSKVKRTLLGFATLFFKNFLQAKNNNLTGINQQQIDLDKKLVLSLAKSKTPNLRQLKYIKRYLTKAELNLIYFCLLIILVSSIFIGARFYSTHLEIVPLKSGEYTEGLVGVPKFINPLYANVSDVDSDIASLVFSSLFKRGKQAELINDLAESYLISQDNKSYTIKIRPGVKWHNGSQVKVDDILFTFNAIKDNQYKSSLRSSFSGVELEKIDDTTIKFNLSEPYAAFLDLLTFGILPQELWQQIPPATASLAELNLKPVGSGQFKFKSLIKDKSGNIKSYTLVRNQDYYSNLPYLNQINFKFFINLSELIAALNNNLVDGISYLPQQERSQVIAQDSLNFYQLNLPQLTAIFFNSKINPALADKNVRQALAYALDKNKIISETEGQDVRLIDSPIFPESFAYNTEIKNYSYNISSSTKILDDDGWKIIEISKKDIDQAERDLNSKDEIVKKQAQAKIALGIGQWRVKANNYLTIELTTIDIPEYRQLVEAIAKYWQAINIKVSLNFAPAGKIQSDIIRQRNFAALLYSEIVGADPDLYAFWHSSQIGEAGLNIADYSNKEVDKLLEDARLTNDINLRKEKYKKFLQILAEEVPAIFLYSPNYTYVQAKKIKGFAVKNILIPRDRFANIEDWYIKTGKKLVW